MFKLMGKEINAILGAQTILIWTYRSVHAITIEDSSLSGSAVCLVEYHLSRHCASYCQVVQL